MSAAGTAGDVSAEVRMTYGCAVLWVMAASVALLGLAAMAILVGRRLRAMEGA